jgi:hypothetical protein
MIYLYIALGGWAWLATAGQIKLYIGFCCVMAARDASLRPDAWRTQPVVLKVDTVIAWRFILLDALSNLLVYSVLMLDFRPRMLFRRATIKSFTLWVPELTTGRFCAYSLDPDERRFRKWTADLLAAFLNGKDPGHIKGVVRRFAWLG